MTALDPRTGHRRPTRSVDVRTNDGLRDFLTFCRLPRLLYDGRPGYGAHLDLERWTLHSARFNPHFKLVQSQGWVARRDGKPVGRIFAQIYSDAINPKGASRAQFGCLDAVDDDEVIDMLLDCAEGWLVARGATTVHGPYSPSINSESGLLVDGFDAPPMVLMPWNPPYIRDALERRGYRKARDLLSYRYDVGPRDREERGSIMSRREWRDRLSIRSIDMKDLRNEVETIVEIFNDAWSTNWGFVPFTAEEFMSVADVLKWIVPPECSFIASLDGVPQAFGIILPNLCELTGDLRGRLLPAGFAKLFWRLRRQDYRSGLLALFGVRSALHRKAAGGAVMLAFIEECRRRGRGRTVEYLEIGWILEENVAIRRPIELSGARVEKVRRIYEKTLGE